MHESDGDGDLRIEALWRVVHAVDWVNGVCALAISTATNTATAASPTLAATTIEDKIAIVQVDENHKKLEVFMFVAFRVHSRESPSFAPAPNIFEAAAAKRQTAALRCLQPILSLCVAC